MLAEQAIFASADGGSGKGYHLVARSAGIDAALAREIERWSPSHASLVGTSVRSTSLNLFPMGDAWYAISRTAYGGPEYSRRGGLQVLTRVLLVPAPMLERCRFNSLGVARTALALGRLRIVLDVPRELPRVELPTGANLEERPMPNEPSDRRACERLADVLPDLEQGAKVCVIGSCDPVAVCEWLWTRVPEGMRRGISVATGIWPSASRPYRIHFLPVVTALRRSRLKALGMDHVVEV